MSFVKHLILGPFEYLKEALLSPSSAKMQASTASSSPQRKPFREIVEVPPGTPSASSLPLVEGPKGPSSTEQSDLAAAPPSPNSEGENVKTEHDENRQNRSRSASPLPEGEYEVEEVMAYDRKSNLYEIKWIGYAAEENTWEPEENLMECREKLVAFFNKRKREVEEKAEKLPEDERERKWKRLKLELPPDPRPIEVQIEELVNMKIISPLTNEEILETYKIMMKGKIKKTWDENQVKKHIADALTGKEMSDKAKSDLRTQLTIFTAGKNASEQIDKLAVWVKGINNITQGLPEIFVENKADLEGPPIDFTYINDYRPATGISLSDDPPVHCQCSNDCQGKKGEKCCPALNEVQCKSYYTSAKRIRILPGTPVFECNKNCTCSADCNNRVVQDGLSNLKGMKYQIFRTDNNRGWGVRTLKSIKKGTFACCYVGEILTSAEADSRGQIYDAAGSTYLFDLDFNETDEVECAYVIDAKYYGNISHFINHSCDPNLSVYSVWVNCLDLNLPKLALFANQDIPKGTELSFDYQRITEEQNPQTREEVPMIKRIKCVCGAQNCRKYFF